MKFEIVKENEEKMLEEKSESKMLFESQGISEISEEVEMEVSDSGADTAGSQEAFLREAAE